MSTVSTGSNISEFNQSAKDAMLSKRPIAVNTPVKFVGAVELTGFRGVVVGYADSYRPIVLLTPPVEGFDLAIAIPYPCLEVVVQDLIPVMPIFIKTGVSPIPGTTGSPEWVSEPNTKV